MSNSIPTNGTPTSASIYHRTKLVRVSPGKCCGFPFAGTTVAIAVAVAVAATVAAVRA